MPLLDGVQPSLQLVDLLLLLLDSFDEHGVQPGATQALLLSVVASGHNLGEDPFDLLGDETDAGPVVG